MAKGCQTTFNREIARIHIKVNKTGIGEKIKYLVKDL